jgi:hypothetical protein
LHCPKCAENPFLPRQLHFQNLIADLGKEPVLAYLDALSNEVIEYTPTSSGSNTIAVD